MMLFLADATTASLDISSSLTSVSDEGLFSSFTGRLPVVLLVGGGLLIFAILMVPRILNRMLNIGPILGLVALLGAAVALPYSVQLAMNQTSSTTQASEDITPTDITFETNAEKELVISWDTGLPVLSAVRYGSSPTDLSSGIFPIDPMVKKTHHEAHVAGLEDGKTYYFEIVSGGKRFNKNGKPMDYRVSY